jgi:hypothetical protein
VAVERASEGRHLETWRSGTRDEMTCSREWMRWRCFYSAEEATEGRGDELSSGGRWCFIKVPVTEEEARGWPFDEGK